MALLFEDSLPQNKNRILQTAVKALEVLLLSVGLISTLAMVKVAVVPYSCEIVFSSLVGFWNSVKCFFSSSLYIWIIINFISMLISTSFIFHHRQNDNQDDEIKVSTFGQVDLQIAEWSAVPPPPPAPPPRDVTMVPEAPPPRDVTMVAEAPPPRDVTMVAEAPPPGDVTMVADAPPPRDVTMVAEASPPKLTTDFSPLPTVEMFVFEENEEAVPSNLSNEQENEEEDTLEATWKTIIGGEKEKPKNKHLKKSETWNVPPRRTAAAVRRLDSEEVLPSTPKWKELRKAVTFNDAVSITCRGGLRRDLSMSVDEFNKRVEAFIKKSNDNMRLERQESNQRFLDMIRRGL